MDDSSIDAGFESASDSKLPIGLAIAGIILGGLAFIFAFSTKNRVDRLHDKIDTEISAIYARVDQAVADSKVAGGDPKALEAITTDLEAFKLKTQDELQRISSSYQALASAVDSSRRNNGSTRNAGNAAGNSRGNAGTASSSNSSATEYVVKPGDMLGKIAREYGCKVADIQVLNPTLTPNNLQVGQKIKVPAKR